MVLLSKIYTRGGDKGETSLGDGTRVPKFDGRIEAYGTVDETNAVFGLVRLHTRSPELAELDAILGRIQNELFDLGADLCLPDRGTPLAYEPLRITAAQHEHLERDIDGLNAGLQPLRAEPLGDEADNRLGLGRENDVGCTAIEFGLSR